MLQSHKIVPFCKIRTSRHSQSWTKRHSRHPCRWPTALCHSKTSSRLKRCKRRCLCLRTAYQSSRHLPITHINKQTMLIIAIKVLRKYYSRSHNSAQTTWCKAGLQISSIQVACTSRLITILMITWTKLRMVSATTIGTAFVSLGPIVSTDMSSECQRIWTT